jgi:PAS domain S-box-containing protein
MWMPTMARQVAANHPQLRLPGAITTRNTMTCLSEKRDVQDHLINYLIRIGRNEPCSKPGLFNPITLIHFESEESMKREQLAKLRRTLETHFDEGELHDLCFDLGVQGLPDRAKGDLIRELLAYCDRRSRVPELVEVGKRQRPDVPWPEMSEQAFQYDAFLSHHSADEFEVEVLARRLADEAGLEPFLEKWYLVPGESWDETAEKALSRSRTCVVFVGLQNSGRWENEKMREAIEGRVADRSFRVIPVLLPGAERGERGRLPAFLINTTWVEFREGFGDVEAFRRLVTGIKGIPPGHGASAPVYKDVRPYRGLQVFEEDHAPFFFGREAATEWLVNDLRRSRFLAVVGPSGCGKSSLVRAGLVPALRRGDLPGSDEWLLRVFRPGHRPLESLAVVMTHLGNPAGDSTAVLKQMEALADDHRQLHLQSRLTLADAPADHVIVLVVDQFEEIFTLCRDEEQRKTFIDNLLYASAIEGGRVVVVLTMRADFYGKCALYPNLAARITDHQMLVGPMVEEELRRAIERPAQLTGLAFERGLVETLLHDVQAEPGALPLLQHALFELWERRQGHFLTSAAYRQIGGVQGAIARRAESIYTGFDEVQRAITRRILLRLIQPGRETGDTRRRVRKSELLLTGADTEAVETVIHSLADARLVTTDWETGEEQVDVSHEALIRGWPRLQGWIDEDRAGLHIHRRLTEAANDWKTQDQDEDFLYGGARLAFAVEWAETHADDLNDLERAFLKASLARQERDRAYSEAIYRINTETDLDAVLRTVGEKMVAVFKASGCIIFERDREQSAVQSMAEHPEGWLAGAQLPGVYSLDQYPARRRVLKERSNIHVHSTDPKVDPAELEWMKSAGAASLLRLPLVADDRVLGLLELVYETHHPFSDTELRLAREMVNQVAAAINRAHWFETVQSYRDELEQRVEERTQALARERDQVETLYRITSELATSLDLDRVLNRALTLVLDVVKSERGSVFMLDQQTGHIIHKAALWLEPGEPDQKTLPIGGVPTRFKRGEGLVGWVMEERQPAIVDDVYRDARWVENGKRERRHRSVLAVPLVASDVALGALLLFHSGLNYFSYEHLRLVEAVATHLATAINNAELYRYVRESATRMGQLMKVQREDTTKTEAILEGVGDGVVVADVSGEVIRFNAAAERILNTPRDQILGRSMDDLLGLYGANGALWTEVIKNWMVSPPRAEGNTTLTEQLEFEGRIVSVLLSPVVMRDEFLGTVSLFRDVTQAVEVERAKSEFISTVSYGLRTPMTSIKGFVDLLILGAAGALNDQQKRFLSIVKTNADRLTSLLNDLLDIRRLEGRGIELNRKKIELSPVIRETIGALVGQGPEQQQTFTINVPSDLPPVVADLDRLTQILTNLVSNAQQYTPASGHITLTACLRDDARDSEENGRMVQVNVTDDGIGIAPGDIDKIFNRFFRSDHPLVQEKAGTGLGLYITNSLVKMHGGELWVESEPGQGSTFSFTLPVAPA